MMHSTRLRIATLAVALALLLPASSALALSVLAPLIIDPTTGKPTLDATANLANNCANVTGTVAIANGGSGQTSATAAFNALDPLTTKGDIIVHDGTNSIRLAVGSNGNVLTADSAQASGVKWAAPSTAVFAPVFFNSETQIPSGSGTWYIGPSGRVSASEADVLVPVGAGTWTNMRGIASATTNGTGSTCTFGVGACTGALTYTGSKPVVTITGTTAVADTSNSATTTAGQCVAVKCINASTTVNVFHNLQIEKTS